MQEEIRIGGINMALFITGFVLVLADCIVVKLFDEIIRPRLYAKAAVNSVMLIGLICIIIGVILMLVK